MNKQGDDVAIVDCTPAEAVVLHVLHQNNNGGRTFHDDMAKWTAAGTSQAMSLSNPKVPRTDAEELSRLMRKYGFNITKKGDRIVSLIWPDKINPKLPQRFSDLKWETIHFDGVELAPLNYATGAPLQSAAQAAGATK